MSEHSAEKGAMSALTWADIKALGDAVLTDDSGVAVGFDHSVVERIIAQALWQAASEVEEECSAQAVPCFCGSAKWLRARAARIDRAVSPGGHDA